MSDWIHCNKCFLRYQPKLKFYVTTCGHLKCEKCVSSIGPEKQCLVCNSMCETALLSNNLKPDIQAFFRPYNESDLKRKQIYTFQHENTMSLLKKTSEKCSAAKSQIKKNYEIIQNLKKQNAQLKMMVTSATKWGFAASTPTVGPSATPMNAPSHMTPIRNSSRTPRQSNVFSKFMPWNQTRHPVEMNPHRQHPQVNYGKLRSVPCFGEMQGRTSFEPYSPSGPTVVPNSRCATPRNPTMMPLAQLQLGSNNKCL